MTAAYRQNAPNTGIQLILVSDHADGQRLDNFLLSRLKGLPKSHLYRLIRKGEVRLNKKRCKPDSRVRTGDIVRVAPLHLVLDSSDAPPSPKLQQLIMDSVLFEDAEILVLNKPAGLAVHAGTGSPFGVIETLRFMAGEGSFRELAHRLDKETSGCLLVAKTGLALKRLQEDFKAHRIRKTYLAIVFGRWPAKLKKVSAALLKFQPHEGERIVKADVNGKASETEFTLLENFVEASLIEARPLTGRTHQIRVHCQQAGHPIIGDQKYTYSQRSRWSDVRHLNLHAAAIELEHPARKQLLTFNAPLRDEMLQLLEQMRKVPAQQSETR
jgi:23S rRNA pseudouridine955/2504/2580 synthase